MAWIDRSPRFQSTSNCHLQSVGFVILRGALLTLLLVTHVSGQVPLSPVVIDTESDTLQMTEGDELNITCTGGRPVLWKMSRYWGNRASTVDITRSRNAPAARFESRLILSPVDTKDTGVFRCLYSTAVSQRGDVSDGGDGGDGGGGDDDDDDDDDGSAQVYIYIHSHESLFVPREDDQFDFGGTFVTMGLPFTIDCRLTHPGANVSLTKGSGLVVGDLDGLTYDPRKGYRVEYANRFYAGSFDCHASLGEQTDEYKSHFLLMANSDIPHPVLNSSHERALVGETVTMSCYVRVEIGVYVTIAWSYTSSEESDRIEQKDAVKESHNVGGYRFNVVTSDLVIHGVHVSDQGVYRCTVTTHDNKQSHRSQTFYVVDRTYVHVTPLQKVVNANPRQPVATLVFRMNAYPFPRVVWTKDSAIISRDDRKFEMSIQKRSITLKIYKPTAADSGNYTMTAITANMSKVDHILFVVKVVPLVSMTVSSTAPYYVAGRMYTLRCTATGVPTPTVRWSWQACGRAGCRASQRAPWWPVRRSQNGAELSTGGRELTVRARHSGYYRCNATNEVGFGRKYTQFIVSEVHSGFGFGERYPAHIYPVVGDNVTIFCNASFVKFVCPTFSRSRGGDEVTLRTSLDDGVVVTTTNNTYSHVAKLLLKSVGLASQGVYHCRSDDLIGGARHARVQLSVRRVVKPSLTATIEGTKYALPSSREVLICDAAGTPTPVFTWLKDGEPVTPDPSQGISYSHNKTQLIFEKIRESDSGVYTCIATNRGGRAHSERILHVQFGVPTGKLSGGMIGLIIGIILVVIIVTGVTIVLCVRRYLRLKYFEIEQYLLPAKDIEFNPDIPVGEQTDCLGYDPCWEFPREKLKIDILLGQGAFGKVMRAEAMGILEPDVSTTVAVKTVKDLYDREQVKALLSELKVMIHIGNHLNILNVLGAVTKDYQKGFLYVITEYCQFGSLRDYLLQQRSHFIDAPLDGGEKAREARTDRGDGGPGGSGGGGDASPAAVRLNYMNVFSVDSGAPYAAYSATEPDERERMIPLTQKDLVCYAFQIARGMDYLASRKYIHRDLAARNVLLADDNVVKICDFGLAKDCYKYGREYKKKSSGPVPVKWLALESLTHQVYSTKSDVWSYGILLWELFTLGGNPYPGIEIDEMFIRRLKAGYRMEKPLYASETIYACLQHCWEAEPDARPTFMQLSDSFGNLLQGTDKQLYLDLNSEYLRANEAGATPPPTMAPIAPAAIRTASKDDGYLNMTSGVAPVPSCPPPAPPTGTGTGTVPPVATRRRDDQRPLAANETAACSTAPPPRPAPPPHPTPPLPPAQLRAKAPADGSHSATSDASSGFHSDYVTDVDAAPPNYDLVMRDGGAPTGQSEA